MEITLNGRSLNIKDSHTIASLLKELDISPLGIAIAVNNRIIKRFEFDTYKVEPFVKMEIIHAVGGG